MSNYYTEKIKAVIIKLMEKKFEGLPPISLIAKTYNVSIQFVRETIENYEMFYVDMGKEVIKDGKYKKRMSKMQRKIKKV